MIKILVFWLIAYTLGFIIGKSTKNDNPRTDIASDPRGTIVEVEDPLDRDLT